MNDRNKEIIRQWNEGLSASAIARALGVSAPLVSSLIRRRRASGEITRPRVSNSKNDKRNAKIVNLWNEGRTAGEVSRALGVTRNVVLATIVKHRARGDITRPMIHSRSERGKMGVFARFGFRRKKDAPQRSRMDT